MNNKQNNPKYQACNQITQIETNYELLNVYVQNKTRLLSYATLMNTNLFSKNEK